VSTEVNLCQPGSGQKKCAAKSAKIAKGAKEEADDLFPSHPLRSLRSLRFILFARGKGAPSISAGALRFCRDERAAREAESRVATGNPTKKFFERGILGRRRAALSS